MTYQELKAKALTGTAEDRVALFRWCEDNRIAWNGECFDLDDCRLYPVYDVTYDADGEIEEMELIDAEFRY